MFTLAVNCGSPERPKNGRFTLRGNVSTYRSVATFSCISGHYYRGSLSAVCQADGQWNVTSPECIRKYTVTLSDSAFFISLKLISSAFSR